MKKKVVIITLGLAVTAGLLFGGQLLVNTTRYRRIISEIEIRTPNLSQVPDGTFNGTFDAILVAADVDVTVESHRIVEITINNHHYGRASAVEAEVVTQNVIFTQSLEVDTVSGATNSSKVILSAIQSALESAVVEQP